MPSAPIAFFAYNRPEHAKKVLASLAANPEARHSELFIFCDGEKPKSPPKDQAKVQEMRDFAAFFAKNSRDFAEIHLFFRKENYGLAKNIIEGVSSVMEARGRAIVLEDDILVSRAFLGYMNAGLSRYENEPKVWSINAWNYPIDEADLEECFFWRIPHCWGWASWADRWAKFKRDIAWVEANFNPQDIAHIDIDGYADYYSQFLLNKKGKIKSWAIFNYLICYKHSGLCLAPRVPFVRQIGFDGSGVHCGEIDPFCDTRLCERVPAAFPRYIEESRIARTRIQNFHKAQKKPLPERVLNKLRRLSKKLAANLAPREREREREREQSLARRRLGHSKRFSPPCFCSASSRPPRFHFCGAYHPSRFHSRHFCPRRFCRAVLWRFCRVNSRRPNPSQPRFHDFHHRESGFHPTQTSRFFQHFSSHAARNAPAFRPHFSLIFPPRTEDSPLISAPPRESGESGKSPRIHRAPRPAPRKDSRRAPQNPAAKAA